MRAWKTEHCEKIENCINEYRAEYALAYSSNVVRIGGPKAASRRCFLVKSISKQRRSVLGTRFWRSFGRGSHTRRLVPPRPGVFSFQMVPLDASRALITRSHQASNSGSGC